MKKRRLGPRVGAQRDEPGSTTSRGGDPLFPRRKASASPEDHPSDTDPATTTVPATTTTDPATTDPDTATARGESAFLTAPESSTAKQGYRPALDGLRAVAVLAVIVYHAGVTAVPGGLLGVDAFFVLSGFLITLLLLGEHRRAGRISLRSFWASRARRLLPALLLLLSAVVAYALTLAEPEDLARLRGDALSALGYVANWHFALTHQGYFDHFAAPSPLLHLWSLGVEEQFYLFWPLAVVLLCRVRRPALAVFGFAAVLVAASATTAWVYSDAGYDTSRIYYGTDTRSQALLAGAALAAVLLGRSEPRRRISRAAVALLGLAGAVGYGWFLVHLDGQSPALYRGGFLLVAVAVGAVLTSVTLLPRAPLARVLSVSPLRWIGRISYGLYLWHWPVFLVVTHERTGLAPLPLFGVRIAAVLAISALSYVLLEQPIRSRRVRIPLPRVAVPALVLLVAASVVAATTLRPAGSVQPQPLALDQLAEQARRQPLAEPATAPGTPKPTRVLLVGDSVALTLGVGLAPMEQQYNVSIANKGWVGCGIARNTIAFDGAKYYPAWEDCAHWDDRYAKWRDDLKPDVAALLIGRWEVVDRRFQGRWTHVGDPSFDAYLATELDNAITTLSKRGAKVLLMTAPIYHARELADGSSSPVNDPTRVTRLNELIREAVERHLGVAQLYDLERALSPDGRYHQELDGQTIRFDDGVHISSAGAALMAPTLLPQITAMAQESDDVLSAAAPAGIR